VAAVSSEASHGWRSFQRGNGAVSSGAVGSDKLLLRLSLLYGAASAAVLGSERHLGGVCIRRFL